MSRSALLVQCFEPAWVTGRTPALEKKVSASRSRSRTLDAPKQRALRPFTIADHKFEAIMQPWIDYAHGQANLLFFDRMPARPTPWTKTAMGGGRVAQT